MLISEKQKSMSWQVRTKDGVYCQPESLSMLYMWVFENRLSSDDFVFNVKVNDWIPLSNMQELLYCFWQLLSSENVIYGPISMGELKQLYINNQISQSDKISLYSQDAWREIKDISVLSNWLEQKDISEIDYIQFIEKINDEYTLTKSITKEEKVDKKADAFKKENAEQKKLIKELESVKTGLEKDLSAKSKELEVLAEKQNEYKQKYDLAQEELQSIQKELLEKTAITEQLTKKIAHAEVTHTLKDDEVEQLRSNIRKLQEELARIREAGDNQIPSSEEIDNLNARINELNNENKKLSLSIDDSRNLLAEKEILLEKLNVSSSEYAQQLKENLNAKETELADIQKVLSNKDESIALSEDAINKLRDELKIKESEIIDLQKSISEKDGIVEGKGAELGKLESIIQEKVNEIGYLQGTISAKEEEVSGYKESLAKLQSELTEKDIVIEDTKGLDVEIIELKAEIESSKQKVEELNNTLREKEALISKNEEDKKNLNDTIVELNQKINDSNLDYSTKVKGLIESVEEKDKQIKAQKKEVEELQSAISEQNISWHEKLQEAEKEINRVSQEAKRQKEEMRMELAQKLKEFINEKDELQNNIKKVNEAHQKLISECNTLQKEIVDRDNDIQSIKDQANKQEEIYHTKIHELESENRQYGHNAVLMRKHVEELEGKLQDSIASGESLKHDLSVLNEELDGARKSNDQIKRERDDYILQLNNIKEEFSQAKFELEREMEQLRHSLQHIEEENRNAQKQFYLEKQKLTKEYTETINKQEKLFKRGQLEREIQDRSKIKEEMERLYNLLRENFEGIQKGADEIQTSLHAIGSDIDDKKLSLKYLNETEKREEKKGQFSKGEQLGESETAS